MHPIKFRQYVWNHDSKDTGGRMLTWTELLEESDESIGATLSTEFSNASLPMLFVGVVDNERKEAYDGDIIQFTIEYVPFYGEHYDAQTTDIGRIAWDETRLTWMVTSCYDRENNMPLSEYVYNKVGDFTIIGNIYENPDLLEWERD